MAQPVTRTVARWVATQRVAVSLALIVATLGLAVPYGTRLPGLAATPSLLLEVVQSVVALAVIAGLAADIANPLGAQRHARWAYLVATALWFAVAAYSLLVGSIIGWLLAAGQSLTALAWAALALYEWRRTTLAPKVVVTDE